MAIVGRLGASSHESALAATMLIVLALPPMRSWAKEVLRQIGYLFFAAGEPDGGGIPSYGKSDPSNPVGAYLTIQQGPTEGRFAEYAMGEAPVIEVQVRGVTGLWVEAHTGLAQVDGESQAYSEKYLFWEEDGLTFVVLSNALSQAEMLKVAESLAY